MGYTHYWYKPKELEQTKFNLFVQDCKKIFQAAKELGIELANGHGEPNTEVIINNDEVMFNGSDAQPIGKWTTNEEISIPWPTPEASLSPDKDDPIAKKTEGNWFAGTLVTQRVAPIENTTGLGSGAYETCWIKRVSDGEPVSRRKSEPEYNKYFDCTKTAYRPYDLIVTAVLIALKHHFPECVVHSDGEEKDWLDGKILCNNYLGYGMDFQLRNT